MIPLEVGKFYAHQGGRYIAVIDRVKTYRWGLMFVIEEADVTGHAVSCTEATELPDTWVEVGREEWLQNFGGEQ
jgi:hypothetical protein